MAELFVANGLRLNYEFNYRVPGREKLLMLRIPAGQQERIPLALEGQELASVILQLERFGAVPENELTVITKPNSLIYRVAKPIPTDSIDEARARDEEARQELAGDKMEESGLKAFSAAQATLRSNGLNGAAESLTESSIEIVEVTDSRTVKDGVNFEATVSKKPSRNAGKIRRSAKR